MPLSEFYGMTRGKIESTQQRTPYSTDQFALRDNDFVELVWENGQIMMQGQSSRRIPISNNFPSQAMKLRDKDLENDTNKIEKFGTLESAFSDFATAISSREIGLSQDDDTVPWWNYPMVNSPQQDYCFELLSELSGVTVNDISAQNKFSSIDYKNSCNQTIRDTNSASMHNGLSLEQGSNVSSSEVDESSISRSGQFFPWSFQESQTSIPSFPSGISNNNNSGDTKCDNCGDSIQAQSLVNDLSGIQIQKQSSGLPNTSSGLINFSHFSRPIALVRANLQNIDAMGGENKAIAPSSSNLIEPMLVNLNGLRNEMGSHNQPNSIPPQVDLEIGVAKPLEEPHNVCPEDSAKNDKLPKQIFGVSASKRMSQGEKTIDPVVASSSVDSGNSGERASNDPTHNLKRKYRETDDSEGRSEDVEEESVSVRKVAAAKGGVGSKRSRAAEVHNLSERKRRDRINEKMRALQELIPNCNKVDKASMLDEAIEYLKTLQLQVQIMSMGTGLYVPPMMSPTGMQHMNAAYMAHFSPMVGGVGMGMVMNNGSLRWPTVHAPSMQGSHFSAPNSQTILGPTNLQGMGGSNLHVIGHPGQRLATSSLRPHLAPLSGGPPLSLAAELNPNGAFVAREVPSLAPTTHSKDLLQTIDSQMVHNTDANSSMNQESRQCSVTTDGSECATLVAPDVGLTKENENLPSSKTTCCDRNQLRNFSKEVDSFCCI